MTSKEMVMDYWRAWNEHRLDKLLDLLASDFVSISSFSQNQPANKQMVAAGFKMFDKGIPDLREEVISIVSEGDNVACEMIETGTFTSSLELPTRVIAPTNRSYKIPFSSFFRINTLGLLVEQRTYSNPIDWAQQVGLDPKLFAPASK